jgi:hypothetical protein
MITAMGTSLNVNDVAVQVADNLVVEAMELGLTTVYYGSSLSVHAWNLHLVPSTNPMTPGKSTNLLASSSRLATSGH